MRAVQGSRYTVKQVADLTGVPSATLRAWERRYGVVSPQRSSSRYRLYDEDEVSRLSRMAELVRRGSPASLAAEHVLATLSPAARTSASHADEGSPPIDDLVRAAQTYDQGLLTALLDDALSRASFEAAVEDWLLPALTEVGLAWERGEVDVAGEHFVSAAVHRRLAIAFDAAGLNTGAPVAVVGLPPSALHSLGALAFAVCLRRQGVDVRFLGADIPQDSWEHSVQTLSPAAVVLSVPTSGDARSASSVLLTLRTEHPDLPVYVGGRGAEATLDQVATATPLGVTALELPISVAEAALDVARALYRR